MHRQLHVVPRVINVVALKSVCLVSRRRPVLSLVAIQKIALRVSAPNQVIVFQRKGLLITKRLNVIRRIELVLKAQCVLSKRGAT